MFVSMPLDNVCRWPEVFGYYSRAFGSQVPMAYAIAAYSLLQAKIIQVVRTDPKWAQHVYKIQAVFHACNLVALSWTIGKFIDVVENRFSFSLINHFDWLNPWSFSQIATFNLGCVAIAVASVCLGLSILSYINKKVSENFRTEHLSEEKENIRLEMEYHRVSQLFCLAQLVLNSTLALFTSFQLAFLSSTLGFCYAIFQWIKMKNLIVTRTFSFTCDRMDPPPRIKRVELTYHTLVVDKTNTSVSDEEEDPCAICMDDEANDQASAYFCANHAYHISCFLDVILTKLASFYRERQVYSLSAGRHVTRGGVIGRITRIERRNDSSVSSYSFTYEIPRDMLLRDPICRGQPPHSYITARIQDNDHGWLPTSVRINPN